MQQRRTAAVLAVLGVLAAVALAGFGGVAYGAHQFSDVGDAHPFHDEIAELADSGITTGFGDGTFRPGQALTRQAMAAFLVRGLPRATLLHEGTVLNGAGPTTATLSSIELTSPVSQGEGAVLLHADFTFDVFDPSGCPCRVRVQLVDGVTTTGIRGFTIDADADETGTVIHAGSASELLALPGGTTRTYAAEVTLDDADANDVIVRMTLSATYLPYGTVLEPPDD